MSLNFKYNMVGKKVTKENLRITCEYCGRTIDTAQDDHCPSCGAVYDTNKALLEHRKRQEEQRRLQRERQQQEAKQRQLKMEQERNAAQTQRVINSGISAFNRVLGIFRRGCLVPVITVVIIGMVLGLMIIFAFLDKDNAHTGTGYETEPTTTQLVPAPEDVPTEVNFGETAEMLDYTVLCDRMEVYDYPYRAPKEGFYYAKFHFIVVNNGDDKHYVPGEMLCQYEKDGYKLQASECTVRAEDLGTRIGFTTIYPDSAAEGWVYHEVPKDTDLMLKYNNLVTIRIPADSLTVPENAPAQEETTPQE